MAKRKQPGKVPAPLREDLPSVIRQTREDRAMSERKVMKIALFLRVENNSKYVRGKKRAREAIERLVLSRYQMEKSADGGEEYVLTIPYQTDEELDGIIYDDILREAADIADARHCFIETDARAVDDPGRYW